MHAYIHENMLRTGNENELVNENYTLKQGERWKVRDVREVKKVKAMSRRMHGQKEVEGR